jgi:predicted O-methyltransferase YrrM
MFLLDLRCEVLLTSHKTGVDMLHAVRAAAKYVLAPMIYRYPPIGLKPQRMAVYLTELLQRASLDGDIAEVGCSVGGTAIFACQAMRNVGWAGEYVCFDTFGGFVEEQYQADVDQGVRASKRHLFSANSMDLVRRITNQHGRSDIRLVQGDATKLRDDQLGRYVAVLADIDLSEPSYEVMAKFWPHVVPGGIIICDDCVEDRSWLAKQGYEKFCREHRLTPEYRYGLGIIRKPH